MREVFICDAARTPIGRYAGALAKVRTDDLAAVPIRALVARNPQADWSRLDEVFFGCANQAGEDNRNLARMALLLAVLPETVPGVTVNRLCASGLNAVGDAALGGAGDDGLQVAVQAGFYDRRRGTSSSWMRATGGADGPGPVVITTGSANSSVTPDS